MADSTVPGELRTAASWFWNVVSPAKARVTGVPLPMSGRVVVVTPVPVEEEAGVDEVAAPRRGAAVVAADPESSPAHPAARASTPTSSAAIAGALRVVVLGGTAES
jgi:hypothetical protein